MLIEEYDYDKYLTLLRKEAEEGIGKNKSNGKCFAIEKVYRKNG